MGDEEDGEQGAGSREQGAGSKGEEFSPCPLPPAPLPLFNSQCPILRLTSASPFGYAQDRLGTSRSVQVPNSQFPIYQ